MAADLPLNLFDCDYENIEWEHDQVTKIQKLDIFPTRSHKIMIWTIVSTRGCGKVPVTYIAMVAGCSDLRH